MFSMIGRITEIFKSPKISGIMTQAYHVRKLEQFRKLPLEERIKKIKAHTARSDLFDTYAGNKQQEMLFETIDELMELVKYARKHKLLMEPQNDNPKED